MSHKTNLVGIIGSTGRMGKALKDIMVNQNNFDLGPGFSRSQTPYVTLKEVFAKNHYIVDFSNHELIEDILKTALLEPKPLVLCSTGWSKIDNLLNEVAKKVPLVIAPNTSIGAYFQRMMACHLAEILGEDYDIDISDKHHRHKVDSPSGTALLLLKEIQHSKKQHHGLSYQPYSLEDGARPERSIGMMVGRSGNIPGEHEVSFVSSEDMISVKHVAFNRSLFAKGAMKIIEWMDAKNPKPGLYGIGDVCFQKFFK